MTPRFKELDVVRVIVDVTDRWEDDTAHDVKAGTVGTVVHVFDPGTVGEDTCIVEFLDGEGRTVAIPTVGMDELEMVREWEGRTVSPSPG